MKTKIENLFTNNEGMNLRKLAIATDCTYQVLLKAAKKPIVGKAYDPTEINYDELAKSVERKITPEEFDAIDFEAIIASARTTSAQLTAFDFEVGESFTLRNDKDGRTYNMLLKTDTHVVIIRDDTTQPRVMSNDTFAHQGPKKVEA